LAYKDLEKRRAKRAAHYVAHKEEMKAAQAAYRAAHREERKAASAAYRAAHPEQEKSTGAAYRAAHKEERRAYEVAYNAAHTESLRLKNARRRALKRGLPATLTIEQWQVILALYKNRCAYCGKPPAKGKKLTKDRVIPGIKGGGYTSDNIVPACGPCNSRKYTNPPDKPVKLVLV